MAMLVKMNAWDGFEEGITREEGIETAKIIEGPVGDLKSHRPLGITCAATLASSDNEPRTWHGKNADGTPAAPAVLATEWGRRSA